MDPDHSSIDTPAIIACPECGGDVCVLKDTNLGWTHWSKVIPRILWVLTFAGLVGYWVSIGQWDYSEQTSGWTRRAGTQQSSSLTPFPVSIDEQQEYISTTDLLNAINGDQEAIQSVTSNLRQAVEVFDDNESRAWPESVKFGLKLTNGTHYTTRQYSFGGAWYGYSRSDSLTDFRDPESADLNPYTEESVQWSVFPSLRYSKTYTGGSRQVNHRISVYTILGVLSVCMVLAWVLRWIGSMCRVPVMDRRGAWGVLAVVLFLGAACIAIISQETRSHEYSNAYQDIALSPLYTIEELREATANPAGIVELCESINELIPESHSGDLFVGQLWNFAKTKQDSSKSPVVQWFRAGVGHQYTLINWNNRTYPETVAEEDLPEPFRQSFWWALHNNGVALLYWGSPRSSSSISIAVFTLTLFPVFFYWVWRLYHWIGRIVVARSQHRRMLRNACVYCGYPLTAEALDARHPRSTP